MSSWEAENLDFAQGYWEFRLRFGMYDPSAKVWRKDLLNALMPQLIMSLCGHRYHNTHFFHILE